MSYAVAGAVSGLIMASVFVAVVPIMLFVLAKDPSSHFRALLDTMPPLRLMLALVVVAQPTWALIGAALGLLYRASATQVSGSGLGSPNLFFTLVIVAVAVTVAAPLALLLRRVAIGLTTLALTFVGLFGWLLPHLAG